MPRHHFGVSAIGGLADVKILTTALFPETRNPEIGVWDFRWLTVLRNRTVSHRKPGLSAAKIPLFSAC
jgi:hypothetical protein